MSLDPQVIRPDDIVRIDKGSTFVRCGYPLCLDDVQAEVEEINLLEILELIRVTSGTDASVESLRASLGYDRSLDKAVRRVSRGVAFYRVKEERFGGKTRSIHHEERPEIVGWYARVKSKFRVVTGEYFPPRSWGGGLWEEYDYEPGGLSGEKHHVVLDTEILHPQEVANGLPPPALRRYDPIKIEQANVTKVWRCPDCWLFLDFAERGSVCSEHKVAKAS